MITANIDNNASQDLITIIPNPFNESINIQYEILEDWESHEMSIIDISGRIVKNIALNHNNKGKYQIDVRTSDLSNGIYFLRYKNKSRIITKKIVKTSQR